MVQWINRLRNAWLHTYVQICIYETGFAKTDQIVTKIEIQFVA